MSENSGSHTTTLSLSSTPRPEARSTGGQLAIVCPQTLTRRITLPRDVTLVGRDPGDRTGKLPHRTVSRQHISIDWDEGQGTHVVTDLKSHNGTLLDGRRLEAEHQPLHDGAVLRLGSVVAVYESTPESTNDATELVDAIPGGSPRVGRLRYEISRAGPDPSPVLVTGETGSGKEHVVRALHELSGRAGPLVALNVAELAPELLESQLFGHTKGAFSGAQTAQPGLFRHASGGTLFMDELGELPLALQPKLLRAIQEQEVRPVGGTRAHAVDLRFVAATNRDLTAEVERGTFRRDLWARLTLLQLHVPSLGQRRGDLLDWIRILHRRWCSERDLPKAEPLQFDSQAVETLLLMEWPENLRGLDRLVHRLAMRSSTDAAEPKKTNRDELREILVRTSAEPRSASPTKTTQKKKTKVRRPAPTTADELADILSRFEGSIRATARWYGRDRKQVYRWMEALGVERGE